MARHEPPVTVGLPVRNGAAGLERAARSVLAQTHEDLRLIISDNCSDDGTGEIACALAREDDRVLYHRQPEDIGLLNNFKWVIGRATSRYFRWIGHDDRLEPHCLERALERFRDDSRLVLVTTQQSYVEPDGVARTARYLGTALGSADAVERFAEMLRLLNDSYLLLDPLYGVLRREPVAAIPRRNMLCEDQVFAAKMALAGPWAHVPEVLAHRRWEAVRATDVARLLDIPVWQARVATVLQCRELVAYLEQVPLRAEQRRRARACVAGLYLRRLRRRGARARQRLFAARSGPPPRLATGDP